MKLNTRTSLVDYMKSMGFDSSFEHRSELWESKYDTPYIGSPAQNEILMKKIRESFDKPQQKGLLSPQKVGSSPINPQMDAITPVALFENLIPAARMRAMMEMGAPMASTIMPRRGLDAAARDYLRKDVTLPPFGP